MNKEILKLAIPNILSNLAVPLMSTVDTALMGRLSAAHLGAVGLGAIIFNFIYWNMGFLRMGTTGITAQAYGKSDEAYMVGTLVKSVSIALIIGVLIWTFRIPIEQLALRSLAVTDTHSDLVTRYVSIRILAAPAALMIIAINGWCFGMQNAMLPLLFTSVANIVNIGLSYYMVWVMGMEIEGVATATVIAQYVTLCFAIGVVYFRYKHIWSQIDGHLLKKLEEWKHFFVVNRDIFLRTICLTLAFAFFYRQSSLSGAEMLAVNVILLQFLNWMSYGIDGFAYASESLVGRFYGAEDQNNLQRAVKLSFNWAMAMAMGYALLYGLGNELLFKIFTDDVAVWQDAKPYLWYMVLLPIVGTPSYIWDGVFVGLTASKDMRNSMLLSLMAYILTWALLKEEGNHGLWLSFIVFLVTRALILQYYYTYRKPYLSDSASLITSNS